MAKKKAAARPAQKKSKSATSRHKSTRAGTSRRKAGTSRAATRRRQSPKVDVVIRRSTGRVEKFDTDRMAQTVSRSGTPFLLARDIAKKVSRRVRTESSEIAKQVESNKGPASRRDQPRTIEVEAADVREMVSDELRKANRPEIASSYSGERAENAGGLESLDSAKEPQSDSQAAKRSKLVYDSTTQYAKH